MKKKSLKDNRKGTKGFYTALCLSTVMVGSACWFAYDQGEKISRELTGRQGTVTEERAVDRHVRNVPKSTTPYRPAATAPPSTAAVTETAVMAEEPAEAVIESIDPADLPELMPNEMNVGITKLENPKAPLADVSEILEPFSGSELVRSSTTGTWQTHNGTDIAAGEGAEVYAVSNGEIKNIENNALWGTTVVLDHHNGFMTRYCGLAPDLQVQEGQMIVSGEIIGTVGNADIESALPSHLHIEMKHHGRYVDPVEYFPVQQSE